MNPIDAPKIEPLTRRKQLLYGALMMLAWVLIGTAILSENQHGAPALFFAPVCTIGFYVWLLIHDFGGTAFIESIFGYLPDSFLVPVGITALILMGAMWLLILLLPLFGDWRSQSRLLFFVQNLYAAIQAVSPGLMDPF